MSKKRTTGPWPHRIGLYWSLANALESYLRHCKADFAWGINLNDKNYNIIYFGDSAAEIVKEWVEMYKSEVLEVV